MKNRSIIFAVVLFMLASVALVQAVSPAPDGGYPNMNTAEGDSALLSLSSGTNNTAIGWWALKVNTTHSDNTAIGAGALLHNNADGNTATGTAALLSNTTGSNNTANGALAMYHSNGINVYENTAIGYEALFSNTSGGENTAVGSGALLNTTIGINNTAVGWAAGENQTNGSNNVYIGVGTFGVAGENNTCYIASIFNQTSPNGIPVLINSNNKLGTTTSSKRFKEDIRPMDKASEALFSLKPVSFRYKKDIDPAGMSQFGLVAEDVEKLNPDLVVRDKEGKPYSVRYDQVNAMLLNEFLKEHRKVEVLEKQVAALTVGLQKVSAQLAASKPAPQVVNNP